MNTTAPTNLLDPDGAAKSSELPKSTLVGLIAVLFASTAFCAWLIWAGARIESIYLNNYGFFCDPSAYYVQNLHLFRYWNDNGTWPSVLHELQFNPRHPLRTVPCLLFSPNLLLTSTGHLWTQAPLLWSFLCLFSFLCYSRTKSVIFSVAATSVFVGLPFLYDPTVGLGAYWLDFTAACALCSAALCLIGYLESKRTVWLIGFGVFASATALSRWSSAFYLAAFAAIAVPLALAVVCGKNWRRLAIAASCLLLSALPGIIFTLGFLELNRHHYQTFGFAFGAPLSQSIAWTTATIVRIIGMPLLVVMAVFVAASLSTIRSAKKPTITIVALWLPLSIFAFVCCIVKAVNGTHPLVYFGPALLIASFIPVSAIPWHRMQWRGLCLLLFGISMWSAVNSYDSCRRIANNAPEPARIGKRCDAALGKLIVETGSPSFFQINDETVNPHLEAFFQSGQVCSSLPIFSRNEAYLKGMYPGESPQSMAQLVYGKAKNTAYLLAVFAHPEDAMKEGVFPNKLSSSIARAVSERTARDRDFRFLQHVESPTGTLAVYENEKVKANPQPIY